MDKEISKIPEYENIIKKQKERYGEKENQLSQLEVELNEANRNIEILNEENEHMKRQLNILNEQLNDNNNNGEMIDIENYNGGIQLTELHPEMYIFIIILHYYIYLY